MRAIGIAALAFVAAKAGAQAPAPARPAPAKPPAAAPAPAKPPVAAPPADAPAPAAAAPAERDDAELAVLAAEPGGLTADEVARRALKVSHNVRARQADVDAAEAQIDQTTAQFIPRLTLRAAYTRLSPVSSDLGSGALVGARNSGLLTTGPCPGGGPGTCVLDGGGQPVAAAAFAIETLEDNYAVNAALVVPLSDYVLRLSHSAAAASASRRSAELSREAEKLKVMSDARIAFYGWVRARGRVAVAQKALERSQARLKDADAAFTLGAITKADFLRLRALVANSELLLLDAQTGLEINRRQLAITMGDPQPRDYRVGESLSSDQYVGNVPGSLDAAMADALSRRLESQALSEASRASRRGARATAVGAYPRLEAFGDVLYANPNQRYFPQRSEWHATWGVGLQAVWTVGDTFGNSAVAAELDARARSLEAQRAALRDGIRQEVTAAYLLSRNARRSLETSRRALEAAEEAYRVATDLYRVGRSTTTELIEAESDLLNARLAELDARIELRVSDERLRHAAGRDARR